MIFGCGEIPAPFSSYGRARAVVLPVPYEGTVSYGKGAARGPGSILKASRYMEFYDEELSRLNYRAGIATCRPLKAEKTPEKMVESVARAARRLIRDGKFVVMLGGEHSISLGLYLALKEKYPDLSVLQIDAHTDLRDEFRGTPYSHGCVMRRICETCGHTVQVGIRAVSLEEARYIKKGKKAVFLAKDIRGRTGWITKALGRLTKNVFLTFDLDGLDPSLVPHTGTPEPGGLLWHETLHFLKILFKTKNVVSFDLVELAPGRGSAPSDFLAARLAYRLIGYKFLPSLGPVV